MFELSTALPAASIIASRFACAAAPAPFDVPNATATSEAEMKPYAEVIEHAPQTIEMIPIRGGKFLMGSPASEPSRRKDEGPQHEVEVGPFWMAQARDDLGRRARLFRERNPGAFKMLTEPNPPVLAKVPIDISREEAGRIFARMLTVGEEEFNQAAALARAGQTKEAVAAFEKLRDEYRGTWIDRVAQERLELLRGEPR